MTTMQQALKCFKSYCEHKTFVTGKLSFVNKSADLDVPKLIPQKIKSITNAVVRQSSKLSLSEPWVHTLYILIDGKIKR